MRYFFENFGIVSMFYVALTGVQQIVPGDLFVIGLVVMVVLALLVGLVRIWASRWWKYRQAKKSTPATE